MCMYMTYPVTSFVGKGGSDCVIIRGKFRVWVNKVKPNNDYSIVGETSRLYKLGKGRIPSYARIVKACIYIAEINVEGACATLAERRLEFKLVIPGADMPGVINGFGFSCLIELNARARPGIVAIQVRNPDVCNRQAIKVRVLYDALHEACTVRIGLTCLQAEYLFPYSLHQSFGSNERPLEPSSA
jgi:hypothetical protein